LIFHKKARENSNHQLINQLPFLGGPGAGGIQDLKRGRRFRNPGGGPSGVGVGLTNLHATPAQSGLMFRIENFFCLGSPLAVFLTLRWRDPQNQEYHEHILPRSLCKYLYNIYHPCDPVAYRVEPIFMKFYSQVRMVSGRGGHGGRAFRTSDSESADFSEVRVRKFLALKTLRTRTQRVCLFTHLYSKEDNISQKKSEISIFYFLKSDYSLYKPHAS
jgi:hypothetical protein